MYIDYTHSTTPPSRPPQPLSAPCCLLCSYARNSSESVASDDVELEAGIAPPLDSAAPPPPPTTSAALTGTAVTGIPRPQPRTSPSTPAPGPQAALPPPRPPPTPSSSETVTSVPPPRPPPTPSGTVTSVPPPRPLAPPAVGVQWLPRRGAPTTGMTAGPPLPHDAVLGALAKRGNFKLTVAQVGDVVKEVYNLSLRHLARAAFPSSRVWSARDLVQSTPGVRVVGTTGGGEALYQLAVPANTSQPEGQRPVAAVRLGPSLPLPVPRGGIPAPTKAQDALLQASKLFTAVNAGFRSQHGPRGPSLVTRLKLRGLASAAQVSMFPSDAARAHRRRSFFVIDLNDLFRLWSAGKVPMAHGGSDGAWVQDMLFLAHVCCMPTTASGGKKGRDHDLVQATLPVACEPLVKSLLGKMVTLAVTMDVDNICKSRTNTRHWASLSQAATVYKLA